MPVQPVFVEEGKPAPNVQWNFAASTVLGPVRKILMLAAVTEELENCTPEAASAVIGRVLADVANRGIDTAAFGTGAADTVKPAGLLHNVTPIAAATAGVDAMTNDLGNLAGAIGATGIDASNVVYVAGPREAQIIKAKVGAKFNSTVLMTLGLPAKSVAAFAPEGVFSGYQDAPMIETRKSGPIILMTPRRWIFLPEQPWLLRSSHSFNPDLSASRSVPIAHGPLQRERRK